MKAIIVFPDYADLKGLHALASPGCRHCGYPEIVASKQAPINDGYPEDHFP